MFDRILVATDGSEHSEGATKFAVDLARLLRGVVTALYVADTVKYFTSAGEVTFNIANEIRGSVAKKVARNSKVPILAVRKD